MKRKEFSESIRQMTKQEIVDGKLSEHVVMPDTHFSLGGSQFLVTKDFRFVIHTIVMD